MRRIAGHGEHVPHSLRVCPEQEALEAHHRGVARSEVGDGLDRRVALDCDRRHQRVHACARHRVVVDVHELHETGFPEMPRDADERVERASLRRVEFDGDDPGPFRQGVRETGLRHCARGSQRQLAIRHHTTNIQRLATTIA